MLWLNHAHYAFDVINKFVSMVRYCVVPGGVY